MLNEVPNNNDVTHVANIVLNKAPNSNDTTRIVNNVCITTMGTQQFSIPALAYSYWVGVYTHQF